MPELPVNEIFESIQCEGTFYGTPALFIRFQGCDEKCSWCDTKNTWTLDIDDEVKHPALIINKYKSDSRYYIFNEGELLDLIKKHYPPIIRPHIVITGGEPFKHDITTFIRLLDREGYSIQIETSGRYDIDVPDCIWITVSPKDHTTKDSLKRASEIKYIISSIGDVNYLKNSIRPHLDNEYVPIHVQPMSCDKEAVKICIKAALTYNWLVSFQVHKYVGIK